jgi:hypothetical protein
VVTLTGQRLLEYRDVGRSPPDRAMAKPGGDSAARVNCGPRAVGVVAVTASPVGEFPGVATDCRSRRRGLTPADCHF